MHGGLFLLTVLTTTLAGTMLATPELPIPEPRLATPTGLPALHSAHIFVFGHRAAAVRLLSSTFDR